MELRPVSMESAAHYPERKARVVRVLGRWVRRVGVAVAVGSSAAFWAACPTMGGEPIDPGYYYVCDDDAPEPAIDFAYPGTFSRYLCPGQSTFVELTVEEPISLRFELESSSYGGTSDVYAVLTDTDGNVAGSLDSTHPTLDRDLVPGVWRVTLTQRSDAAEAEVSLHIDEVPDLGD